jgi:hypothetical protein
MKKKKTVSPLDLKDSKDGYSYLKRVTDTGGEKS